MRINELTIGPIVGETTPHRVRIWGRGDTTLIDGEPRRCFGALRYRATKGEWSKPVTCKMNPNFDMSGVAILSGLDAETRYEYQFGYFFSDVELKDATRFTESDWSEASQGSFLTASDDVTKPRTLVIGSCRYLLKTFLGDFFDTRGDKTFKSILAQIKGNGTRNGSEIHQLIMMGDQIYADDLNIIAPDRTLDQFYRRYRVAFSQEYIRRLMSRVPTYMTLDDHEIEDNWPSRASQKDWLTLFPAAIHAYQTYQLSHSPNIPIVGGRLEGTPDHYWYSYSDGCCDVFVTDTRTERFLDTAKEAEREIVSRKQMLALKRWLADGSGRVKLIVTSVPFFPDPKSSGAEDKWAGFQRQRREILEHIEKIAVPKVVFCAGDVHVSLSAELISPSGLKILSVVSSAFFWPYPQWLARGFDWKSKFDGGNAGIFQLKKISPEIRDNNFTRLTITPKDVKIDVFTRKGAKVNKKPIKYVF